jgi:carbon monoxide dehydrogenase subunit G
MKHIERTLDIDATPDAVWAVLERFMHIEEFAPLIKSVDALTEGEGGVGSKRRCHFNDGTFADEEVTKWEPGRGYRVRLTELKSMLAHEVHAEITVEPLDDGRTRVFWAMEFVMKYGPFGWLLGQTMVKMMLGKVFLVTLKGLDAKVQSNRISLVHAA